MHNILCIVGARPNFMKIAPIIKALQNNNRLQAKLVHTGQHYDVVMNQQFFEQLQIPTPDVNLEVGSASHAQQTAEIMRRFEPIIDHEKPSAVLVVGDVNSTLACSLVAAKKQVPIIHVEAGLRSYDRTMPEEINRVLTDQLADLLFTTERSALDNLCKEGIDPSKVYFVGNVMIDTLRANLKRAIPPEQTFAKSDVADAFLKNANGYGVLTLHRPTNVDDPKVLHNLLQTLAEMSRDLPLIFPVHPRTKSIIDNTKLSDLLNNTSILQLPPLGYLEMLGLMLDAKLVLTDSGGLQEETTALGVPCITLRTNTERPITVEQGTNTVVGTDRSAILKVFQEILRSGGKAGQIPEYWDGYTAERITQSIIDWLIKDEHDYASNH